MRSWPTLRLFPTRALRVLSLCLPALVFPAARPRAQLQVPCGPPLAMLKSTAANIFSQQQEQWLGDAMADYIDSDYRPIRNPRLNAYLDGFSHVGDLIYLSTGDNRTIVYSFNTGAQVRQFFGTLVAADNKSGTICSVNRRDDVIVMDKTGAELQHRSFGSPLRFAELRENGTQLVVLTADGRCGASASRAGSRSEQSRQ